MLEDKDAIRELLHRYCFCMDEGRFAELAALFTEDGEWIAPYRSAKGPADIAAWLQQSVPPQPRRVHYVMNSIIDCDGARATARSNYLVMVEGAERAGAVGLRRVRRWAGEAAGRLAVSAPAVDPRVQGRNGAAAAIRARGLPSLSDDKRSYIIRSSGGTRYNGVSPASARLILAIARRSPTTPVPAIAAAELCGEPITFGSDMNG